MLTNNLVARGHLLLLEARGFLVRMNMPVELSLVGKAPVALIVGALEGATARQLGLPRDGRLLDDIVSQDGAWQAARRHRPRASPAHAGGRGGPCAWATWEAESLAQTTQNTGTLPNVIVIVIVFVANFAWVTFTC